MEEQDIIIASMNAESEVQEQEIAITETEMNEKKDKLQGLLRIYLRRTKLVSLFLILGVRTLTNIQFRLRQCGRPFTITLQTRKT